MFSITPTKRHNIMCAIHGGHSAAYVAKKNGLRESEVLAIVEASRKKPDIESELIESLDEFNADLKECPAGEDVVEYLARIGYRITKRTSTEASR